MKNISMALLLWLALSVSGSGEVVTFDESTPELFIFNSSGLAGLKREPFATPVSGLNCIKIGVGDFAVANVSLIPGQKYKVTARRHVHNNAYMSFDLYLNGIWYMHDGGACMNNPITFDKHAQVVYLGYYQPSAATTEVKITNGGLWGARVDWIKFEATSDKYFDGTASDITYSGSSYPINFWVPWPHNSIMPVGHDPERVADNNQPNGMYFDSSDSGVVTGTINLAPSTIYQVYACRKVHTNGLTNYDVQVGGKLFHDSALTISDLYNAPTYFDEAMQETKLGEILSTSSGATNVTFSNGGLWAGRVAYLRFVESTCSDPNHYHQASDLNNNCMVDLQDFAILGSWWLETANINPVGHNLLVNGNVETGWSYTDPNGIDWHVTASMTGNGRGDSGNALSYANSTYDLVPTWLNFSAENSLALADYIPNNGTVYVGAWVKVSSDFAVTSDPTEFGVEVRLKVSSPTKQEEYWSNSVDNNINSLVFGWGAFTDSAGNAAIASGKLTTDWQYFEFPVKVGDSGEVDGWGYVVLGVTDRVSFRGDLAGAWTGTIYLDDLYVGLISQVPQTPLPTDLSKDGVVNWEDIEPFVDQWLQCTDPVNRGCDPYWL